ncbi:uncharacterized protein LOC110021972 isoform X2 [Phalaenopsis equestris]|uniref:uncharacterized protein LOC110021972 isoform X2 n=1 Tax=Phalaenopsis equestris TaxID=78828 RepID=UPI0009E47FCF|nr:uncharacterized protein LOC110021972 isoform X2 [Phalaenopsis equestris]
MLALTSCGCSSSSSWIPSLPTLNRKHLSRHPHGFCPPLPRNIFSIQKSVFSAIHRCQYFLHIDSHGGSGKWPVRFSRGTVPLELSSGENEEDEEENGSVKAKTSGTSARGRRLLRVREEKRKREYDRIHNYPTWAKILENACKDDEELRAVLGDSVGNPELMRKRVEERVRKKGRDFRKSKTGSVLAFKVSFRDFNPTDSFIWFELYSAPSDRDLDLLGSVIQSWYVMGRLGAFNSLNLQLANSSMNHDPLYDADVAAKIMPSSFHDISDLEFQDNWGRVWVDLGTSDYFAVDVLLNCLTLLSSEWFLEAAAWEIGKKE